jgi:MFS family permease
LLAAGLGGAGLCLLPCMHASGPALPLWLALAAVCVGLQSPMVFAIGQTLAGPRCAGRWMGVQNLVGNLSGVIAPLATGVIVDRTGSFAWAFVAAAAVCAGGVLAWGLIVRRVVEEAWPLPALALAGP